MCLKFEITQDLNINQTMTSMTNNHIRPAVFSLPESQPAWDTQGVMEANTIPSLPAETTGTMLATPVGMGPGASSCGRGI